MTTEFLIEVNFRAPKGQVLPVTDGTTTRPTLLEALALATESALACERNGGIVTSVKVYRARTMVG